ncbi:protein of unknown function [Pararobbsia alpina]
MATLLFLLLDSRLNRKWSGLIGIQEVDPDAPACAASESTISTLLCRNVFSIVANPGHCSETPHASVPDVSQVARWQRPIGRLFTLPVIVGTGFHNLSISAQLLFPVLTGCNRYRT